MKSKPFDINQVIIDQLSNINNKIDKLDERLDSSEKIAIKQELNLKAHMKRSDLLEAKMDIVDEHIRPVIKAYTVAWGISKIVAGLSVLLGIITTLFKLIGIL